MDMTADPAAVAQVAAGRRNTACVSATSGFGIDNMLGALERMLEETMVPMRLLVPYSQVRPGVVLKSAPDYTIQRTKASWSQVNDLKWRGIPS